MLGRLLALVAALLLASASADAHAYARPLQSESALRGFAVALASAPRARDAASASRIKENCLVPLKCASSLGVTGYQLDRQTSEDGDTSYYAKARHYSAGSGSFLSVDPWQGTPSQPMSLHRYLYAYANPTVYVDPDGRVPLL
ncbi:MAG: RHS repeat-associated core domain-containing protein, partial [Burkholderiales bacterium]